MQKLRVLQEKGFTARKLLEVQIDASYADLDGVSTRVVSTPPKAVPTAASVSTPDQKPCCADRCILDKGWIKCRLTLGRG